MTPPTRKPRSKADQIARIHFALIEPYGKSGQDVIKKFSFARDGGGDAEHSDN